MTDVVDLDRYPVAALDSAAGEELVARCRADLAASGACELPGFLRADVAERIVHSLRSRSLAYRTEGPHDIDFSGHEAELEDDDPLSIQLRSARSTIAYDVLDEDSPLRAVYESDLLTRFVGAALQIDPIYRHADPLGALIVMFYDERDELGWHFDKADFVVTLMLQPSDMGGVFEYAPMLRSVDDPNPEGVRRLLTGDRTAVHTMSGDAGTLALFRGRLSPHRVTPIVGSTPRINAVLSYAQIPDARMSVSGQRLFYGRTAGEPG
jgi:hypothetical protein